MQKIKVGIIGSGNIGCDLLVKILKSEMLECTLFMGRNCDSKGMRFASDLGVNVSDKSINALIENPALCDVVFDATSAASHIRHSYILKNMGIFTIDLTPSLVGKMCVPAVNGNECLQEDNINMVTCGGQATIPVINAVCNVIGQIDYIETVTCIASNSAGHGTRENIDEFTQTTKNAIKEFSTAKEAKAIIILNPAEPPVIMHNTIYFSLKNTFDKKNVISAVKLAEAEMKKYVPGYKVIKEPVFLDDKIIVMVQIEGSGDYLPKYCGNLDIITSCAVNIANLYAERRLNVRV